MENNQINNEDNKNNEQGFDSLWVKQKNKCEVIYNRLRALFVDDVLNYKVCTSISIYKSKDKQVVGIYLRYSDNDNNSLTYFVKNSNLIIKTNKKATNIITDNEMISKFLNVVTTFYKP